MTVVQLQRSVLYSDNFLGSSQAPLSRLHLPLATLHSFNSNDVRQAISRGPTIDATKITAANATANRSMIFDSRVKCVEVSCGKSCNWSGIHRLAFDIRVRQHSGPMQAYELLQFQYCLYLAFPLAQ